MKNRRGQTIIEAILILMIFVIVSTVVAAGFKDNELLSQMVQSPWTRLAGMIQNGHWSAQAQSGLVHPTRQMRHISVRGEVPQ